MIAAIILSGMAGKLDPMHPSAEGKGLTLLSGALAAVGLVVGLIPVLWWWDAGGQQIFGIEREQGNLWHMLWGLPVAVLVYHLLFLVGILIGGVAAGLKRVPLRNRKGPPVLEGIGGAAFCLIWVPVDDRPARRRYWTFFAALEGFMVNTALLAIALAALFWSHGLARDLLLLYAGVTCLLSASALMQGDETGPLSRGDMLHRLSVDGPSSLALDAVGRLARAGASGTMPEEWDTSLVQRLQTVRDGSILHLYCLWVAFLHYAESKEFARADEILNEAMELAQRHNARAKAYVMLEAAYAQALRGEGLRARQIMESIDVSKLTKGHLVLYRVALAINEGRRDAYDQALKELKALKQNPALAKETRQLEERAAKRFDGKDHE